MKHPYDFPKKKPFLWTQGKQYGGRSLTWGGITLRLSSEDFHPAKKTDSDQTGLFHTKKFPRTTIFIENFCGIYGRKDDIKEVPNGKYIGEIPLTENENVFGSKVKSKLNYPFIQSRGFDRNSSVKEKNGQSPLA